MPGRVGSARFAWGARGAEGREREGQASEGVAEFVLMVGTGCQELN